MWFISAFIVAVFWFVKLTKLRKLRFLRILRLIVRDKNYNFLSMYVFSFSFPGKKIPQLFSPMASKLLKILHICPCVSISGASKVILRPSQG